MKKDPLLLVLTLILLLVTVGVSFADADRVISSKTEYFPLENVLKKKIDLADFELFSWEAVKVTQLTGQNPWEPLDPGKSTCRSSDSGVTISVVNAGKCGGFTFGPSSFEQACLEEGKNKINYNDRERCTFQADPVVPGCTLQINCP